MVGGHPMCYLLLVTMMSNLEVAWFFVKLRASCGSWQIWSYRIHVAIWKHCKIHVVSIYFFASYLRHIKESRESCNTSSWCLFLKKIFRIQILCPNVTIQLKKEQEKKRDALQKEWAAKYNVFSVELIDPVTFLFHFLYFYLYIVFNILVCGCKRSFFFFWVIAFQYVPIECHGFSYGLSLTSNFLLVEDKSFFIFRGIMKSNF